MVGIQHPKRFAAWLWMLCEARWKPGRVEVNGKVIDLDRGQFACSIRRLAEQVGMTVKECRLFLSRLERDRMVSKTGTGRGTGGGSGVTVITICNYDVFQDEPNPEKGPGAQSRAQEGHRWGTGGAQERRREKEGRKKERDSSDEESLSSAAPNEVENAVEIFNAEAARVGWPQCQKLTKPRQAAIRARLAEVGGLDGWRTIVAKAGASSFLTGRTAKPWTGFGIDWLSRPANFEKIAEGNYDDRKPADDPHAGSAGGRQSKNFSGTSRGFAAVARRYAEGSSGG